MKPNKDINAPLLLKAAEAWTIGIGKDTIYLILSEIKKLNLNSSDLIK